MDQQSKDAEAYRAGKDAYLYDPEGRRGDANPYHPESSMWHHFERGLQEEAEKQAK